MDMDFLYVYDFTDTLLLPSLLLLLPVSLSTLIPCCVYTSVFGNFPYSLICDDAFPLVRLFDLFGLLLQLPRVVLFSRAFVPRFDISIRQVMQ